MARLGRAAVPSGRLDGRTRGGGLRDNDKTRYLGKGRCRPRKHLQTHFAGARSLDAADQTLVDHTMLEAGRHAQQGQLGAETPSWRSRWRRRAASRQSEMTPLYRYIGE